MVIWEDKGLFWEANVRDGPCIGRLYEAQVGKKHQMQYVEVEEALAMVNQEQLPLLDAIVESLKGYFTKSE